MYIYIYIYTYIYVYAHMHMYKYTLNTLNTYIYNACARLSMILTPCITQIQSSEFTLNLDESESHERNETS